MRSTRIAVLFAVVAGIAGLTAAGAAGAENETGWVQVCKASTGSPGVTGTFSFTVGSVTTTAPVGGCSTRVEVRAGTVTVTEAAVTGTTLDSVSASPSEDLTSSNLTARTATLDVDRGQTTVVTFTNRSSTTGTGFLEICKASTGSPAVTGDFTFTVGGHTVTVPTGKCSDEFALPLGSNTITETARTGFSLSAVSADPSANLTSSNLTAGTATVNITTGDETTVTFANAVSSDEEESESEAVKHEEELDNHVAGTSDDNERNDNEGVKRAARANAISLRFDLRFDLQTFRHDVVAMRHVH